MPVLLWRYVVLALIITAGEAEEMVSWRECPCTFTQNFGSCNRFISRGTSDPDHASIYVNLQSCNINAVGPADLPLPNARTIDLRYNHIESINADDFKQLTNVEYFRLENNSISGNHIHPDAFKSCRKLRGIGFSFNDMRDTPSDLLQGLNDLKELWLYGSNLDRVPIFVTKSYSLEVLELPYNEIILDDPDTFSSLTKLKTLLLSYNLIEFIPKNAFISLKNIEEIHLNHNNIVYIPEQSFAGLAQLKDLYLQNNHIEYIPQNMIKGCVALQKLNLSYNKIIRIPEFLAHVNHPVQIDFSYNPWQCGCSNELIIEVKQRQIHDNNSNKEDPDMNCPV